MIKVTLTTLIEIELSLWDNSKYIEIEFVANPIDIPNKENVNILNTFLKF